MGIAFNIQLEKDFEEKICHNMEDYTKLQQLIIIRIPEEHCLLYVSIRLDSKDRGDLDENHNNKFQTTCEIFSRRILLLSSGRTYRSSKSTT